MSAEHAPRCEQCGNRGRVDAGGVLVCAGCGAVPASERPAAVWDCDAYGPGGAEVGAVCFFGGQLPQVRLCADREQCGRLVAAERQRVFDRIQALAAAGDETGRWLATQFSAPDQLLNGGGEAG